MLNINKVLVIGAGTMGSGIAQWFLQSNCEVHLNDANETFLTSQKDKILNNLNLLVEKKKIAPDENLVLRSKLFTKNLSQIDHDYDLIIEAIIEDIAIKHELFKKIIHLQNEKCLFASNTSSLSINKICEVLPNKIQKNFLGIHFFNPATIMPLVEIIQTNANQLHIQPIKDWFQEKGKQVVICEDSPAFIVNRVARNFYGEALKIADIDSIENFQEIDLVLKEVGSFKMGPFELMDLIGIDINYAVTESVWKSFLNHPRFSPHPLQKSKVEKKEFGRKSKKGFYQYE